MHAVGRILVTTKLAILLFGVVVGMVTFVTGCSQQVVSAHWVGDGAARAWLFVRYSGHGELRDGIYRCRDIQDQPICLRAVTRQSTEEDEGRAQALLNDADRALETGNFLEASEASEAALAYSRKILTQRRAFVLLAQAYCSRPLMDDHGVAQRYADRLDTEAKEKVKSTCRRKGVELR